MPATISDWRQSTNDAGDTCATATGEVVQMALVLAAKSPPDLANASAMAAVAAQVAEAAQNLAAAREILERLPA